MTTDNTLERQFHTALIEIYRRAKVEAGDNTSRFLQLVKGPGGLLAAKQLISGHPSVGFTRVVMRTALWEKGRLDLSVECHVLQSEFEELFSDSERQTARVRREQRGFRP